MKTIFKGKLLLAVAGALAVVAVACASPDPEPEPPVSSVPPPTLAPDDPNFGLYYDCRVNAEFFSNFTEPTTLHELVEVLGLDSLYDFCELSYNEMAQSPFFIDTPAPQTKSEAPYPVGVIPVSALDSWTYHLKNQFRGEFDIGSRPCGALVTEFRYGYVKNQLIFATDDELDAPIATITDMLRQAGLEFNRIEVFTAEDYAQHDTNTFLNFLAPSNSYDFFEALRENVGFVLRESNVEAYRVFLQNNDIMTPIMTFGNIDDGKIRYQVKIYADNDIDIERLEALNVGEIIEFGHISGSTCPQETNPTIIYFAGGIWTTFGDDLVWD